MSIVVVLLWGMAMAMISFLAGKSVGYTQGMECARDIMQKEFEVWKKELGQRRLSDDV